MDLPEINRWLRDQRNAQGLSLREYSVRAELSRSLVAGVLSQVSPRPVTSATLPGLLRGLGLPEDHPEAWAAWVAGRVGAKSRPPT